MRESKLEELFVIVLNYLNFRNFTRRSFPRFELISPSLKEKEKSVEQSNCFLPKNAKGALQAFVRLLRLVYTGDF